MGQSIRKHLLTVALIFTVASIAQGKINRIYEPIVVSQTLNLSPHRICHDGLFIYFINTEHCQKSAVPGFNCEKNYHIAPIRSAELIHLPADQEKAITRFYHIDLKYHYQEIDVENNITLLDEMRTLSPCEDRNIFLTENVTTRRPVQTPEEELIVASLIEQAERNHDESFLILNTPIGTINRVENLSKEDMKKPEAELQRAILKTPFCNDLNVDADKVWQMSGSYTGSGKRSLLPAALQTMSRPLYVKRKIWVVNKETKKMEMRYEFTCEKTWEI